MPKTDDENPTTSFKGLVWSSASRKRWVQLYRDSSKHHVGYFARG